MAVLKIGAKAPTFKGKDQDNNSISLADFKGKKLALYFYPADMTPTCTVQACNLKENFSILKKHGIEIVGVSPDDIKKHKKFAEKHDLPFPLIADTTHEIIEKYAVWGEKKLYGRTYMGLHRTTFLIDEKGVLRHIISKPKSKDHAAEIIEAWKNIE